MDRGLRAARNLELHARLWGVTAARRATASTSSPTRSASPSSSTAGRELQRRPAPAAGDRPRPRLPARRCCSSTSPPSAWTRASATSCSTRSLALRARARTMTILLTTHYLDEAERLCDRVAIIHDGEIVALDTPAALLAGLGGELLELRVDGDVPRRSRALRGARRAGDDAFAVGSTLTLPLHGATAARRRRRVDDARRRRQRDRHPHARPSTTSTCASPATALAPPPDPEKGPTHGHHHRRTHRRTRRARRPAAHLAGSRALRRWPRRRAALTAHNPRQIAVPLLTPILFALVIAPALKTALGGLHTDIDYTASWPSAPSACSSRWPPCSPGSASSSTATAARSASCSPRRSRARCWCSATCSSCSACARCRWRCCIGVAALRGADFHVTRLGRRLVRRRRGALHRRSCTAIAETLAARIRQQEEYIGATPGDRDPAVVLRRRAVSDRRAARRADRVREVPAAHARDGADALRPRRPARHRAARHLGHEQRRPPRRWLSLAVVALFAVAFLTLAIRAFTRSAVT